MDNNTYQTYKNPEERRAQLQERDRPSLVVDGKGTERQVSLPAHTVISKPKHQFGITTLSEYIDKARELANFRIAESLWKDDVRIDIKTPYKWFAVQPWGDFHIGSHGCDYDELERLLAGVLSHENLKTVLVGNIGDFFVPKGGPGDGMLGEVFTPMTQLAVVKKFFTEYQDEILVSCNSPDHEDWVYRSAGLDIYEYLVRELDIPLVTAGGSTILNINGIEYDLMLFHKIAKFKSAFNLTHGHKRALELQRDADVVIAGHTHKPDYEWGYRNGHEISLVQVGTLETKETGEMYGKKEGFLGPVKSVYPIILFNTTEKKMQLVTDLDNALPYLCLKMGK